MNRSPVSEPSVLYGIVEDEAVRDSITVLFVTRGLTVRMYSAVQAFLDDHYLPALASGCLVIDVSSQTGTGVDLLKQLRDRGLRLPAVILGGPLDKMDTTVLEKPVAASDLITHVERALGRSRG
jgi:two-component system response regulator FixJ